MEKFSSHMEKFGILYILGAFVIALFVGSQWDKWFPASDGTTATRKRQCIGDCQGISAGGIQGYAAECCKNARFDVNGNPVSATARGKCPKNCLKPSQTNPGYYTCDCPSI